MSRFSLLLISLLCFIVPVFSQVTQDSLVVTTPDSPVEKPPAPKRLRVLQVPSLNDSLYRAMMADSFSRKPARKDSGWAFQAGIPLDQQVLQHHPYFGFNAEPKHVPQPIKKTEGRELLFYAIIAFLLLFAFLRNAFSKYFHDLFRLFFRTTLKYRQIREQLMQTPLPSLMLNAFFVLSAGLYATFLLRHYNLIEEDDFWLYFFYCCLGISAIYLGKFLSLKIIGWIFNRQDAAGSYIFIVFVINKVIGVFLIPFNIMLAFLTGTGYTIALVVSWFGIAGLILYRFILTYSAIRNQVRFNPFQFFLYICAFEVAPLLLIYKLLLVFFQ